MSSAAGGARAKPLPLALHPVCTQILLLVLLFPKSRTKMPHTNDSGKPINQLLFSCESAQLYSAPCSLTPSVAPSGASCLQKPAPRPDPCSWPNARSVPWLCSGLWAWPAAPSPLLRLLPGAQGLPRPGLSAAERQPRCRPSPASLEPGPACSETEELHLRGLNLPCSAQLMLSAGKRGEGGGKLLMNRITGCEVCKYSGYKYSVSSVIRALLPC